MDALFTITGTTPNAAGNAQLGAVVNFKPQFANVDSLAVYGQLVGATGGTLDLYLQTSPDLGVTWYDYAHFAQLAAGAAALKVRFGVAAHAQQTTITTVGVGTTPVLAAGTVVGGPIGGQMRCLAIAGAGTTAGAAITLQLYASGASGGAG